MAKKWLQIRAQNLSYLLCQSLPLRGYDDDSERNFIQLLKHHAKEEADLRDWLEKEQVASIHHVKFKTSSFSSWPIRFLEMFLLRFRMDK